MTATPTTPQSGAPWPDPAPIRPRPDVPSGPSYAPGPVERTAARQLMARHDGNRDRQLDAAFGRIQGCLDILAIHVDTHPECGPGCDALASQIRQARAYSAAFDRASLARAA